MKGFLLLMSIVRLLEIFAINPDDFNSQLSSDIFNPHREAFLKFLRG